MPLHSRKMIGLVGAMRDAMAKMKPSRGSCRMHDDESGDGVIQISKLDPLPDADITVIEGDEDLEEAQEPETDEGKDPQDWLREPMPKHSPDLTKLPVPKGWGRGNKVRSTQAVGRHAGNMNRRGVYPDTQKDLGWGDGNERDDDQHD